jgi:hypothetical protein
MLEPAGVLAAPRELKTPSISATFIWADEKVAVIVRIATTLASRFAPMFLSRST